MKKKKRRVVVALLLGLMLAGNVGSTVNFNSVDVVYAGNKIDNPKNGNSDDNYDSSDEEEIDDGGSSGGDHGLDSSKLDDSINAVTAGTTVDSKSMSKAKKILTPFGNFLKLLTAICFTLVALWIPVTVGADLLVAFMPFLDKYIGAGTGGGPSPAGGPNGTGKGFHIQLTSSHPIRSGSGGASPAGGPGGSAGAMDFSGYIKNRGKELIYCFLIIGLMVSGLYSVLLNKIIEYLALIVVAILNLVFDIADGFLK